MPKKAATLQKATKAKKGAKQPKPAAATAALKRPSVAKSPAKPLKKPAAAQRRR